MKQGRRDDVAEEVAAHLPSLRRYARALSGSQETGDDIAADALRAILENPGFFERVRSTKVALFRAFQHRWAASGAPVEPARGGATASPEETAQWRMRGLTRNSREALLLHCLEGFSADQIGEIMDTPAREVEWLIGMARKEIAEGIRGRVLIIEDEAIIAMDLSAIVALLGHDVVGVARTRDGAVELARREPPDLVLADVKLADASSGIAAVHDITRALGDLPVVFITAYPERLLTGARHEPAFLISKPYAEEQVLSAVSQAMFFANSHAIEA